MKQVTNNMLRYAQLFDNYDHSIPIVFSALEGQYPSHLYVDNLEYPKYGLLFTKFNYNYIGFKNIVDVDPKDVKQTIIKHIHKYNLKECIMFAPSLEGEAIIKPIFESFHGVVDIRFSFIFDHIRFYELSGSNEKDKIHLTYLKEDESTISYPQCEIVINNKQICYAKAFMLGKSNAELDIYTDEMYRRNGYALSCAFKLIHELLNNNFIPNWTAWKHNQASHNLAFKLGFQFSKEINAYVWVDEFCEI